MKWPIRCVALVEILAASLSAQEVTGGIEGRVRTVDGISLGDVDLVVTSSNLPGQRVATTNQHGRFTISALPVGTYRLQVRRIGFRPVAVENVPVRLGETTSLPGIVMTPAAVELTELVVIAEVAGYDPANTAQRIVLDATRLDALPLERNFREIMLFAPSAIPSYLGAGLVGAGINRDGINVAGATGYENTYFVDGINITSPIRGETSIDLPYNFIHQIEVRTGGTAASDAQALGGVVNVVTPSGGNHFRSQLFGYFSDDALETAPREVQGYYQTGFTFYDVGASLSGPVVKDRLWFFAAYNGTRERRDNTFSFGELSTIRRQHLFAGKITWQAGPRTSATLTILGDPTRAQVLAGSLFGTGVPQNPEVLQRNDEMGGIGLSIRGQHQVHPRVLLEGSLAQMTRMEEGEPATEAGREPIVIDHLDGTLYGGHGFAYRLDSRRRAARADLSWQAGPHALKGGLQYEVVYGDITIDIARSSAGGTVEHVDTDRYTWHSNLQENGRGTNRNPALYIQDMWQLSSRVLVSAGLRWSRQELQDAGTGSTYSSYQVRDGVQPRASIVFQPGKIGTQRVFAAFTRVAEQLPTWGFQDFAAGAESTFVYTHDPTQDPSGGVVESAVTNGIGSPAAADLRGQTVDAWTVGYNRQVGKKATVSVTAMRRSVRRVLAAGLDTTEARYIWGNPGEREMSHFPAMTRTYDALEATFEHAGAASPWFRLSYVLSRTRGNYPGLYGSDWRLGFTNGTGPMFILPGQHEDGIGLLPNDRTHVLKAIGSYALTDALSIGSSVLVASGTPLSEYGAVNGLPSIFRGFASPRGTSGRTPTIWDLGVRASYQLPLQASSPLRARLALDVQHIGSPRAVVDKEQRHYTCTDPNGNQSCPSASYGRVNWYQPPMMARLGVVLDYESLR